MTIHCRMAVCAVCCRRYYQPPSAYDRGVTGLTGTQGKPLWMVLTLLLTIVGSSLAVGFGWATHCHWALYAVGGGEYQPDHASIMALQLLGLACLSLCWQRSSSAGWGSLFSSPAQCSARGQNCILCAIQYCIAAVLCERGSRSVGLDKS